MALWHINYEDRYHRSNSFYHECAQQPSQSEALEIVCRELRQFPGAVGNQQQAFDATTGVAGPFRVTDVEEVRL